MTNCIFRVQPPPPPLPPSSWQATTLRRRVATLEGEVLPQRHADTDAASLAGRACAQAEAEKAAAHAHALAATAALADAPATAVASPALIHPPGAPLSGRRRGGGSGSKGATASHAAATPAAPQPRGSPRSRRRPFRLSLGWPRHQRPIATDGRATEAVGECGGRGQGAGSSAEEEAESDEGVGDGRRRGRDQLCAGRESASHTACAHVR